MTSSRNLLAQTSQTHISQLAHFLHQEARVLLANLNDTTGTIKNVKVWVLWKLKRLQNFDICTPQIFLTSVASVLYGNKFKILVYKLFWLCEPNLLFCLDFNCVLKPPQLPDLAQILKKNRWKKSEYILKVS